MAAHEVCVPVGHISVIVIYYRYHGLGCSPKLLLDKP